MKLSGKKVAVLGYGIVGKASLKYAAQEGALVTLYDNRVYEDFDKEEIRYLEESRADLRLGSDGFDGLSDFDLIISSPGIDPKQESISSAVESGVKLYTDISLFLEVWNGNGPVIGVTGSNGKSTTVSLIDEALRSAGRETRLGGNIGTSPLTWLTDGEEIMYGTYIILELSSYALEYFNDNHYVDILVFTSFSENHLSRHNDSMEEYAQMKCRSIKKGETKVILSIDDKILDKYVVPVIKDFDLVTVTLEQSVLNNNHLYIDDNALHFRDEKGVSENIFNKLDDRKMKGVHNLYNIAYTICVLKLLDIDVSESEKSIRGYRGLPHRIEFIRDIEGVGYYNDSKSTSPDATLKALDTLGEHNNIVLIAGGVDKGVSYTSWKESLHQFVKHMIILPGPAEEKLELLSEMVELETTIVSNMEEAIHKAKDISSEGDTVLLSPGAASLNMWNSFEERGDEFRNIVGWL